MIAAGIAADCATTAGGGRARRRLALGLVALGLAAMLAGCGGRPDRGGRTERGGRVDPGTTLVVLAASSLTEAFAELAEEFAAAWPGVSVIVTTGGSQILRLQIEQGVQADLFASANLQHMAALRAADLVASSEVFAHNELAIIVPADNPAQIAAFDDLWRAQRLVVGTRSVPVGIYTEEVLTRAVARYGSDRIAQLRARIVSEESNVRLVRAKVELGEADAAMVYVTDAVAADGVRVVPLPDELAVRVAYSIGTLTASDQPELARALVAFIGSRAGRAILQAHGFLIE